MPPNNMDNHQEEWNRAHQANIALEKVPIRGHGGHDWIRGPLSGPGQTNNHGTSHQPLMHNVRSSSERSLPVSYPVLPTSSSQPDPQSYSPTSSDIDALEESFLDLEIQSTRIDGGAKSKSTSQTASSANYSQGSGTRTPASLSSPWGLMEDLEFHMNSSIEDRLPAVWRE